MKLLKKTICMAACMNFAGIAQAQTSVNYDFTGTTKPLSETKSWTVNNLTVKALGGTARMLNAPTGGTSVGQTVGGLGIASASDWDTFGLGFSTINYSFTGAGETLFLEFDKEVQLNRVKLNMPTSSIFPSFVAVVYAVDESGERAATAGLSPTAGVANSIFGTSVGPVADGVGLGSTSFDVTAQNMVGKRFGFSGILGIDHIDTNYILGGVTVTVPEPTSTTLAGVAGMLCLLRRRR